MGSKKVAVAVIHGMGSQGSTKHDQSDFPSFSAPLRSRVRREVGAGDFDTNVAWREIFWSDILQKRQENYLEDVKGALNYDGLREFVLCNLSDAASYRKSENDRNDNTYTEIHSRIDSVIKELSADVEKGAPLIILAHSLGGQIMSNYIYDNRKPDKARSDFENLLTLGSFITFGCNIPIFVFAYEEDQIFPIKYPGTGLPEDKRVFPWWKNFFDKDDILGYPLAPICEKYRDMIDDGELAEYPIDSGGIFASWNPFSHNGYWKDRDFYRPVASTIRKHLKNSSR